MNDLRKAAEQALEALRYTTDHLPAKTGVERYVDDAITTLQVALVQPEQEPVDWEAVAADQAMTIAMMKIENKKEWVALTDEDIHFYALDIGVTANKAPPWLVKYARDIEAKLKEKHETQS
jgi:hypothetical protein